MTPPLSDLGILVIDMQDKYLTPWNNPNAYKNRLIESIGDLLDYADANSIKVWLVEFYGHITPFGMKPSFKSTAAEITRGRKYPIFNKFEQGAFEQAGDYKYPDSSGQFYYNCYTPLLLDDILTQQQIKKLVVAGVHASFCVLETILGAQKLGYEVRTALELIANNLQNFQSYNTPNKFKQTLGTLKNQGMLAD